MRALPARQQQAINLYIQHILNDPVLSSAPGAASLVRKARTERATATAARAVGATAAHAAAHATAAAALTAEAQKHLHDNMPTNAKGFLTKLQELVGLDTADPAKDFITKLLKFAGPKAKPADVMKGIQDAYYDRTSTQARIRGVPDHLDDEKGIDAVAQRLIALKNAPQQDVDRYREDVIRNSWLKFIDRARTEGRLDSIEDAHVTSFKGYIEQRMDALNKKLNALPPPGTHWNKDFPNKFQGSKGAQQHHFLYQGVTQATKELEQQFEEKKLELSETTNQFIDYCDAAIGQGTTIGFLQINKQIEKIDKQIGGMTQEQEKLRDNDDVKKSGKDIAALGRNLERQELLALKREKESKEAKIAELQAQTPTAMDKFIAFKDKLTATNYLPGAASGANLTLEQQKRTEEITRLQQELGNVEYRDLDARIAAITDYDTVEAGPALDRAREWRDLEKQKQLLMGERNALDSITRAESDAYSQELATHKTAVGTSLQNLDATTNPTKDLDRIVATSSNALNVRAEAHTRKSPSTCADVLNIAADGKKGKMPTLEPLNFDHFRLQPPAAEKAKLHQEINALIHGDSNKKITGINELLKRLKGLETQRQFITNSTHLAALNKQEAEIRRKLSLQIKLLNSALNNHANSSYLASYSGMNRLGKKVQELNKKLNGISEPVPTYNKDAAKEGNQTFTTVYFERDGMGKWKAKDLTGEDGKPIILSRADIREVIDDVNKTLPEKEKMTWSIDKRGHLIVDCKNPATKNAYISALKKKDAELKKAQQDPNAKADDKTHTKGILSNSL